VTGRRVVVTGAGAVSPMGRLPEFWLALQNGSSGIRRLEGFDTSELAFTHGAQVLDYDEEEHFDRKSRMTLDRFAQFFVLAARDAIRMSGITFTPRLQRASAVITGSCLGGVGTLHDAFDSLVRRPHSRVGPFTIPRVMDNAGASRLTIEYGIRGPAFTISTACSSSAHAIGLAFWLVRQGVVDVAVTGGSETPFTWPNLKAWDALRVVSPDVCRPFSKNRQGLVLGEGGAAIVLETLDHARARGAEIYAELAGCGMSADAYHITMPSADGAAEAIENCLADAGMRPEEIDYVNAHGTGTLLNDIAETRALRKVFGAHADRLPVSSTKSMHGHALGASAALEATATIFALRDGIVPPTISFSEADPECDIDAVPNTARRVPIAGAISSSFAFGGFNAALAFRRWDEERA
jgi:nodulation protein E